MDVAVVVPVHNTPLQQLDHALQSVAGQTLGLDRYQLVVIEDGPSSISLDLASMPAGLLTTHLRLDRHEGLSAARNAAVAVSGSEFVLFLDADDVLHPNCLVEMLACARSRPQQDLFFANSLKMTSDLTEVLRYIDSSAYYSLYREYRRSMVNPIFHAVFVGPPVMVRRSAFVAVKGFDRDKPCGEITDLAIRLHAAGYGLSHLNRYLYLYRTNPSGLSTRSDLHAFRASALQWGLQSVHGATVQRIDRLGRVNPFGHMHYNVFLKGGEHLVLPYLDYEAKSLRDRPPEVPAPTSKRHLRPPVHRTIIQKFPTLGEQ